VKGQSNLEIAGSPRNIFRYSLATLSIVFERIMINGNPAFFPKNEEPFEAFQKLWKEREPVFQNLATITVENTGTVDQAVENIITQLK